MGNDMQEIRFLVQGSAAEPYKVIIRKSGNNLSAYCTCPAGENGQYCRHRFNILGGIIDGVVSGNEEEVKVASAWIAGTDVEVALNNLMDAEVQFESAKNKLTAAKKQLAKAFRD